MPFNPIDFILNIDQYIGFFIQNYGQLTYIILFLIIFIETGLVFMPFLPGDSLLFVSGTFSSQGMISITLLFIILSIAAILGDSINYTIGKYFGEKILTKIKFVKKEYLQKTKDFYKKYGGKTIIYARFIPIIRTFAPFVAGVGRMEYKKFLLYNIIGAVAWVALFLFAGYYFGTITFVKEHLTEIIYLIIIASIIPPIIEVVRNRRKK